MRPCALPQKVMRTMCPMPPFSTPVAVCACALALAALVIIECLSPDSAPFSEKFLETQKLESLGIMAAGLAHDFNNLLTIILGHASLVRENLPREAAAARAAEPAPIPESLDQIETAANRAAELCRQMLACAGKTPAALAPVNLNDLVADTAHMLRRMVEKNAALQVSLATAPAFIKADAAQIRQIVMNLVINACEALEAARGATRPGRIFVSTSSARLTGAQLAGARFGRNLPPGDYFALSISDNGPGMSHATLARIFDPFFTTKFTGRGLGLAAIPGMLRAHGASLSVASAPGKGAHFTLCFPAIPATEPAPSPARARTAARPPCGSRAGTILVVDDEPGIRKLAAAIIERHGYTPALASDGYEALALGLAHGMHYAAILLDRAMPGLDGEATLKELRAMNKTVPVLMMSGGPEADMRLRFSHDDAFLDFLPKPFSSAALAEKLLRLTGAP